jgi:hypothetical protein
MGDGKEGRGKGSHAASPAGLHWGQSRGILSSGLLSLLLGHFFCFIILLEESFLQQLLKISEILG